MQPRHFAHRARRRPGEAGTEAPHQHHLEIQQFQPVAKPLRADETGARREGAVAQAQPLAQPPDAPGVETQDQQAAAVVEDTAGLAQHVVRQLGEFQGVRQQHGIDAAAQHRQLLGLDQGLGIQLADRAQYRPVQGIGRAEQALAAPPVADLQDVAAENVRQHPAQLALLQGQQPPSPLAAQPQGQGVTAERLSAADGEPVGHG